MGDDVGLSFGRSNGIQEFSEERNLDPRADRRQGNNGIAGLTFLGGG
jgi:hypothetical protein